MNESHDMTGELQDWILNGEKCMGEIWTKFMTWKFIIQNWKFEKQYFDPCTSRPKWHDTHCLGLDIVVIALNEPFCTAKHRQYLYTTFSIKKKQE